MKIMRYVLEIVTKDGGVSRHYYDNYDEMYDDSVLCQFSTNIIRAVGKEDIPFSKPLFVIG